MNVTHIVTHIGLTKFENLNFSLKLVKYGTFYVHKMQSWLNLDFMLIVISEKIPSLKLIIDVDFSIYTYFYTQILIILFENVSSILRFDQLFPI